MKVSSNFILQEFIDPVTFKEHQNDSIKLIDKRLVDIAQYVRTLTGLSCIINNWHLNGSYSESGLRRKDSKTGAKYSAHKEGKAIDLKISNWSGKKMYQFILENLNPLYSLGLRQIEHFEVTPTWLHLATRGKDGEVQIIDTKKVRQIIKIND